MLVGCIVFTFPRKPTLYGADDIPNKFIIVSRIMHDIYARTFDANLIRVFLAIWDTRGLTRAADRLGLTQPAISHALKRLRERLSDPLFVRGPGGMEPTGAAHRLHAPFQQAHTAMLVALTDSMPFDPTTSARMFRIAMSDISEAFFLPRLSAWLASAASSIRVESVPLDALTAASLLRTAEVDLAIGHAPQLDGTCENQTLFTDSLVCLVRKDHPQAQQTLTPQRFASLRHIDAGSHAPGHTLVDLQLDALGLRRLVSIKVRHLMTAPVLVRGSDLAVIYPRSLAQELDRAGEFAMLELPFATPPIDVKVHVRSAMMKQADIAWLVATIRTLFAAGTA